MTTTPNTQERRHAERDAAMIFAGTMAIIAILITLGAKAFGLL